MSLPRPGREIAILEVLGHCSVELAVGRKVAVHGHHRVDHAVAHLHCRHLWHLESLHADAWSRCTKVIERHACGRLLGLSHSHLRHHWPHALRLRRPLLDLVQVVLRRHGHVLALQDLHILLQLLQVFLLAQSLDQLLWLSLLLLLLFHLLDFTLSLIAFAAKLSVLSLGFLQFLLNRSLLGGT